MGAILRRGKKSKSDSPFERRYCRHREPEWIRINFSVNDTIERIAIEQTALPVHPTVRRKMQLVRAASEGDYEITGRESYDLRVVFARIRNRTRHRDR